MRVSKCLCDGVFNMEGGCYAKTIDLSAEGEPQIFNSIKYGALLENIGFEDDGVTPNYKDDSITPNTRVSYPVDFIPGAVENGMGGHPTDIFFLKPILYRFTRQVHKGGGFN